MGAIDGEAGTIVVSRAGTPWRIERAAEKLRWRAQLPGAFVYDRAAAALRDAEASGVSSEARLAMALPASWLVNAKTSSATMRRWCEPPSIDAWLALVDAVGGGPEQWLDRDEATRVVVVRCLDAIHRDMSAIGAIDASETIDTIEAVSKVLALLVSEGVPLMPAESRAFALSSPLSPPRAGDPGPTFLAMLDWFSRAVLEVEPRLVALARDYDPCPLDAAQVLDRLLYFDSIGHRHFPAP